MTPARKVQTLIAALALLNLVLWLGPPILVALLILAYFCLFAVYAVTDLGELIRQDADE